jgi:molybdopterin converting factor small subunit
MALIRVTVTQVGGNPETIAVQDGTTVGELLEDVLEVSSNTPFTINAEAGRDLDTELVPGDEINLLPKKSTSGSK